jgi:hypothetical protein
MGKQISATRLAATYGSDVVGRALQMTIVIGSPANQMNRLKHAHAIFSKGKHTLQMKTLTNYR